MADSLRLIIQTPEDLTVVSSLLQDSVVRESDIHWSPQEKRFAFLCNRFKWEKRRWFRKPKGERVRTGLHLDGVLAVTRKGITPGDASAPTVLSLLAITTQELDDQTEITFTFSGGGAIRLQTECAEGLLTDIGDSWDAIGKPDHT